MNIENRMSQKKEIEKRLHIRAEITGLSKTLYFAFRNSMNRHENNFKCSNPCAGIPGEPCAIEESIFLSTVEELSKEMKNEGIDLSYSAQILICQAAMTLIRIFRAQLIEATEFSVDDGQAVSSDRVHPLYYGYLPKLQKALVFFLDELGITPKKKAERKSVKIAKRLEFEIEALQNSDFMSRRIKVKEKASAEIPAECALDIPSRKSRI